MRGLVAAAVVLAGCGRIGFGDEPSFELVLVTATWDQARAACAAIPETHLATIHSTDENERAAALAATIPFDPVTQTSTNQRQRMWVGGHAPVDIAQWDWVTGEPYDFSNWRAGEPSPNELCMIVLGSEAGAWDNRPCDMPYEAYLCERD